MEANNCTCPLCQGNKRFLEMSYAIGPDGIFYNIVSGIDCVLCDSEGKIEITELDSNGNRIRDIKERDLYSR